MRNRIALLWPLWISLAACRTNGPTPAPEAPPASALAETLESHTCGSIARLHVLGGVFLASQPAAEDFEQARAEGVRTIINLRAAGEQGDFDERAVVTGLGLAYVSLPISGAAGLDDATFERARELLNTAERPILLHCASANRVGAVWIPWRVLEGGLGLEQAVVEAKTIGLKTPELEAKARDYVMRHPR